VSTTVKCSVCGGYFNSTKSYQDHLPCRDAKTLGGSGDVYSGSQETVRKGGTGEYDKPK